MEYYDNLWHSIERHAEVRAVRAAGRTSLRRGSGRLRPLALAICFVVVVSATWKLAASTGRGLPIMGTPVASAADIRGLPTDIRDGIRASETHPFSTPNGAGYAAFGKPGNSFCLVVPDWIPKSYGSSCAPTQRVESTGLAVEMSVEVGDSHYGIFAVLLPKDTPTATFISERGERVTLRPQSHSGVVAFKKVEDGTLQWQTTSGITSRAIQRFLPEGVTMTSCADGKMFTIPAGVRPEEACAGRGGWNRP